MKYEVKYTMDEVGYYKTVEGKDEKEVQADLIKELKKAYEKSVVSHVEIRVVAEKKEKKEKEEK